MITRVAAVLIISVCCTTQVQAQESKFYYGLSITSAEADVVGMENNGLGLKFGREFGKFMAIEAHAGTVADSSENLLGDPQLTYSGAFFRLNLPFERVNLYVLGGAASMSFDVAGFDDDELDRAVGVGIDLLASENSALTIELMNYGTEDDMDIIEIANFGFTHRFDFPELR